MFNKIQELFTRHRNLILYGLIGVSAVVVDYCFFLIFYDLLGIDSVLSTIMSVAIATVYAFIPNAYFNFRTKDVILSRLVSYSIVSLMGMVLSAIIIRGFDLLGVDSNIGKAISIPPIVVLQYLVNRKFAFKETMNRQPIVEQITKNPNPKKIAVIGGGFTGLTAAYRLAQMGHKVEVFEAEAHLGGLVAGFEVDGLPLEKAYHFLYKTDKHIIGLANEIGIGDTLKFYPSSIAMSYGGKLYPFMTPMHLLRFTPLSFINRIRAGVIALYLGKETAWKKFSEVTAYAWMKKWAGEQVTKIIWEPVLRGKFFNYFDRIAMSYVWSRVYIRVNSKDKGDVTEKLGYFAGGFQTFTARLVEKAKELGVEFHTGARVDYLKETGRGAEVSINGEVKMYDACLSTLPSPTFKRLIENKNVVTENYLRKLTAVDYLGAVLMVFTTKDKFTDYYWHNVNDLDQPFLVLLSLSALVGPENLKGKHVSYIGAYVPHDHQYFTMSDDEIKALWIKGVKRIFPDFDESNITSSNIFRFKNAQHIVEPHYQEKILPYRSELPHLYLSNFTQIFPDDRGTNYAVEEGTKVAKQIDADLSNRN